MDAEKITVISGEPRSGTSLMMQTLELLGVPIVGEKYPQASRAAPPPGKAAEDPVRQRRSERMARRLEHARRMNPRGFYEIPGVVMRGLRRLEDDLKGKAIKIITNGLCERTLPNGKTVGTPWKLIDRIVYCVRDPRHVAVSQKDLSSGVEVAAPGGDQWVHAPGPISPLRYVQSMGAMVAWLCDDYDRITERMLIVDYEQMHTDAPLAAIAEHLGVSPGVEQLQAAAGNIDPLLKRSTEFEGWPEAWEVEGALAERIYAAVRALDRPALEALRGELEEMAAHWRLERTRFVDTEYGTWVTMAADLCRKVRTDEELRRRIRLHVSLRPCRCGHYDVDENHTYAIPRPADLGDLVRPMVSCGRDDDLKTYEECKHCWQRGWTVDGVQLDAQRRR